MPEGHLPTRNDLQMALSARLLDYCISVGVPTPFHFHQSRDLDNGKASGDLRGAREFRLLPPELGHAELRPLGGCGQHFCDGECCGTVSASRRLLPTSVCVITNHPH